MSPESSTQRWIKQHQTVGTSTKECDDIVVSANEDSDGLAIYPVPMETTPDVTNCGWHAGDDEDQTRTRERYSLMEVRREVGRLEVDLPRLGQAGEVG